MIEGKDIWIKTGYEIFAISGVNALKIESLSKIVGISKSSFYHHFADLEIFIQHLLDYHIQQAYIIANKENNCKIIDPELIDILVEHKIDLLFNRQLRINSEQKHYFEALAKSNRIVGNNFVVVWMNDLKLNLTEKQLAGIFELALENFYLQINDQNLNYQWLSDYFKNLKKIVQNFA